MPISGTFYTSQELQVLLDVSRQRVSQLATQQGWYSPTPGLYDGADVGPYLTKRRRTELLRQAGWWNYPDGLCEWDEVDTECPTCEAYAVYRPAKEEEIQDLSKPVYSDGWPFQCANGHAT